MLWAATQPATQPIPSGGLAGEGAESARYEYNGLHWRTRRMLPKEYGTSPSYIGTEEWRYFHSAAWQLLEERVDEDADSTFEIDQLAQQFWGLRYIDDAVARRVTSDWEEGWDRSYYHITNVQFSTESLISDMCELVERIRYDAHGRARHIWRGDLDQDGTFWFIDCNIGMDHIAGSAIGDNGTWPSENYNVLMDFDFSGTIEQDEHDAIQNDPDEAALTAGRMSDTDFASGPWNSIGYDSYVYDDAADMSCVRFRWYEAKLGRWVSRDPISYSGSKQNLYLYAASGPGTRTDPLGLLDITSSHDSALLPWNRPCPRGDLNDIYYYHAMAARDSWEDPHQSALRRYGHILAFVDDYYPHESEYWHILLNGDIPRERSNRWLLAQLADQKWLAGLPDCPGTITICNGTPVDCNSSDWKAIGRADQKYHPGASWCMRSKSFNGSAQQCCYDQSGNLKRDGLGVGTPDKQVASFCNGVYLNHWYADVRMVSLAWDLDGGVLGLYLDRYLQARPPSQGGEWCY